MNDVYEVVPVLENDRYKLRFVSLDDADDLLQVYSDVKAVPFFNSDNCGGDDFYYKSRERMVKAIEFWIDEYKLKYYVRWTIFDKINNKAIGTIELFNRKSSDYFNCCGLLRLDLKSEYETEAEITDIMSVIMPNIKSLFGCDFVATKAVPSATERIKALENLGFTLSENVLIGHGGTKYNCYYEYKLEE